MSKKTIKEVFKEYPTLEMSMMFPEDDKEDPNVFYGNFLTKHIKVFHEKEYRLAYIMKIIKLDDGIDYGMHDVLWYRRIEMYEDDYVFNGINFRTEPFDIHTPGHQELYDNLQIVYTDDEAAVMVVSLLNIYDLDAE